MRLYNGDSKEWEVYGVTTQQILHCEGYPSPSPASDRTRHGGSNAGRGQHRAVSQRG